MADQGQIRAFLGDGTEFEGLLSFDGTVRIDGRFKGEIQTNDTLIIGESGHVEAEVKAGHCIVMGVMIGNIRATGKVEVANTGKITGNLFSPVLIVQEGGMIEGNISMKKDADQSQKIAAPRDMISKSVTADQRPH